MAPAEMTATHTTLTTMMIQRKQVERRPERRIALLVLLLFHSCCWDWQLLPPRPSASGTAQAFTPPLYGLAGLVNPVRNVQVTTASESNSIRAVLADCADFFVDAFGRPNYNVSPPPPPMELEEEQLLHDKDNNTMIMAQRP